MSNERSMKCAVKIAAMLVIIAITVFAYMLPDNYVYADSDTVIKTVEVTLHANGGSFKEGGYGVIDTDTCVVKFDVYEDREPSYVNVDMRPSREGKVLIGWSTDKDAQWETWTEWFDQLSEESGMYEFALPMDGSVKDLYAVWADLYPITLNANGGSFGTKTDRYGNVSKIETFDLEFWNEKGGRVYKGSTALPDIDTDDMNGLEHVGWSADKNAKRPEYGKDFEGLELNASTPKILYAVFGDPKEGNATIIPKQTVYNFDLNKNKTGRIDYSVYWDGFVRPTNYSTGWDWKDSPIGTDGKYEFNKVLFMTGGDADGFSLKNNVFVNDGWLEFEILEKGSVKLIVYAKINDNKVESQVITVNVTDGTSDPTIPSGANGTAPGEVKSIQAAEAAIAGMTSDKDLPDAVFNKIQLKSSKQTKTSITLSWKKVTGAKTYVIYGNKCGKNYKPKKLATVKGKNTRIIKKIAGKNLKKGTYYKFIIVAIDKNNNVVSTSKLIHVATKGGKVGNYKSVTVKKSVMNKAKSLKKGKTFKLNAKAVAQSKKLKVKKHVGIRYESTNKKVATVSNSGKITAKKKGTCYIYAYAQNGVFKKIKVVVK